MNGLSQKRDVIDSEMKVRSNVILSRCREEHFDVCARDRIRFIEGADNPVPFSFPLTKKWSAGRRQGFARPLMTNLGERFVRVP
jgi:hypothetical protein